MYSKKVILPSILPQLRAGGARVVPRVDGVRGAPVGVGRGHLHLPGQGWRGVPPLQSQVSYLNIAPKLRGKIVFLELQGDPWKAYVDIKF